MQDISCQQRGVISKKNKKFIAVVKFTGGIGGERPLNFVAAYGGALLANDKIQPEEQTAGLFRNCEDKCRRGRSEIAKTNAGGGVPKFQRQVQMPMDVSHLTQKAGVFFKLDSDEGDIIKYI